MEYDYKLGLTLGLTNIFTYAVCGAAVGFSAAVMVAQTLSDPGHAAVPYLMLGTPILSTALGSAVTFFGKPFKDSALYLKGQQTAAKCGAIASIFGASVCLLGGLTNDGDVAAHNQTNLKQTAQAQPDDRPRAVLTI